MDNGTFSWHNFLNSYRSLQNHYKTYRYMKTIVLWVSCIISVVGLAAVSNLKMLVPDQEFVLKAADGGMLEVELGNLAVKNGTSPKVKEFGQMMVKDHTKVNEELKALAKKKQIEIPATLSNSKRQQYDSLAAQQGEKFDMLYMNMMIASHEETIGLFQTQSNKGQDKELKKWAASKEPALKHHLEMAKALFEMPKNAK
jgi:putative membrane protein